MKPPELDYLSPLPPVRSGISDYSADLLPHLAALAPLRVVRLPEQPVAREIEERWRPVAFERLGEGGRLPLYQMGNNRHHTDVRAAAMRLPGVVTLHDVVLHHLLLDETIGRGEWVPYRERLVADHGWIGEAVAWGVWWGVHGHAQQFSLPAHRALLRRQRGVLVHSEWAARRVLETDPEIAARVVPMGVPLPPPPSAEAGRDFRLRHRLPPDALVLGSFGFQTPMKRTGSIVAALASAELASAHLVIVGEVAEVLDFDHAARAAGVADRVHVLGYVPFAEFEAAIAAVDICLNLRYPTAGETSASLLRVLACGRPAVLSEYGQFAELPAEIALQVPLRASEREEGEGLAAAVAGLFAEPNRLRAMGAAARRHVEREHDPARAARAIVEACAELAPLAPRDGGLPSAAAGARVSVPPPSILLQSALRGRLEVFGADLPWNEGERRSLRLRLTNDSEAGWLSAESGDAGMAIEWSLLRPGAVTAPLDEAPWLPVPRDLAPGESQEFRVSVRRPPGPVRLRIKPRLLGREGFSFRWQECADGGSAIWERAL